MEPSLVVPTIVGLGLPTGKIGCSGGTVNFAYSFCIPTAVPARALRWLCALTLALGCGLGSARAQATGGTVTQVGADNVHTFGSNGTFTVPAGGLSGVSILLVGGGGGGGTGNYGGGGGGGGGVVFLSNQTLTAGSYSVVVGAGGMGASGTAAGQNGGNSNAFGSTAYGGGGGGAYISPGIAGGCGGGAGRDSTYYGTVNGAGGSGSQGFGGGNTWSGSLWWSSGGGGGAGGAGQNGANDQSGRSGNASAGGIGIVNSINGAATYYAGGGGGAWAVSGGAAPAGGAGGGGDGANGMYNSTGTPPTAGRNGLGGGGGAGWSTAVAGANGGSGVVVIRYPVMSAPTVAIVSGNNQSGVAGQFNGQPFDAAVWNGAGTQPIVGTSLTFAVQSGGGLIAATTTSTPTTSITVTTDVDGTGKVYYRQPSSIGITSQIIASSGGAQVTFTTQSITPTVPPNAPGWAHTSTSAPTAISLTWANATPGASGAAISGYNIYRNGTLLNGSPQLSTSYTDNAVTAGTTYAYTIKAVDTTGALSAATTLNVSAPANSTSGTFELYQPTL